MKRTSISVAFLAVLALLALVNLGLGGALSLEAGRSQDMQYSGSRLLVEGRNPYEVFLAGERSAFLLTQFPNYLPLLYSVLSPIGALPWELARMLWMGLNLLMTLILGYLLYRKTTDLSGSAVVGGVTSLVFLSSLPVRAALANGQLVILVTFCIAMAFHVRHPVLKGALLAIATTKYSLGAFFLALVSGAGRLRVLGVALAILAAGYLVLALRTGTSFGLPLLTGPLDVNKLVFDVYAPFTYIRDALGYRVLLAIPVFGLLLCLIMPWHARRAARVSTALPEGPNTHHQRLFLMTTLVTLSFAPHADYDFYLLVLPFVFFRPFQLLGRSSAFLFGTVVFYYWNGRKLAKALPDFGQDLVVTAVWLMMLVLVAVLARDLIKAKPVSAGRFAIV